MLLHHTIKGAHYLIPFFGGGIDSEFIAAQLRECSTPETF